MTKQRIKINLPLISTRSEAEAAMNDLSLAANNKRKLAAKMDAERLAIENKYAGDLAVCDAFVKEKSEALRAWAESNPTEFGKKKSIEFLAGTLGFRTGTPKLALLSRAWNWDKVLATLKANLKFKPFIRTKEEVDKDAIIGTITSIKDGWDGAEIGVKVVQDESFYVEPKLTDSEVQS